MEPVFCVGLCCAVFVLLAALYCWLVVSPVRTHFQPNERNINILQNCPSLTKGVFWPSFFLFNGHLQTVYTTLYAGNKDAQYEREVIKARDGGSIAIDWALGPGTYPPHTQTLIVIHGLTGGSHENYVRDVVSEALGLGYRCVVVNSRGCADSDLTSPSIYCGASSDDLRTAVTYIRSQLPEAPLVAVGFSLGANILVKYLGEEGSRTPLKGAVSVSNPFDLLECSRKIASALFGIYDRKMAENLIRLVKKHEKSLQPLESKGVSLSSVYSAVRVREIDDRLTRRAFGYATVDSYYRQASSVNFLKGIAVPLLCLNALDDPICTASGIGFDECLLNPNIILALTKVGGHVGWFSGLIPRQWLHAPCLQFLTAATALQGNPSPTSTELVERIMHESMNQELQTETDVAVTASISSDLIQEVDRILGHARENEQHLNRLEASLNSIHEESMAAKVKTPTSDPFDLLHTTGIDGYSIRKRLQRLCQEVNNIC